MPLYIDNDSESKINELAEEYSLDEAERDIEEDGYPCNTCASESSCDGWDARFCCTLCYYFTDEPDCENCDPYDT